MCVSNIGDIFKPHKWFASPKMPPMPTIEIPKSKVVAPLVQLQPMTRASPRKPQDISRFAASDGISSTVQQILGLQIPQGLGLMIPGGN